MQDGSVVTWEPFTRPKSQLMVIEGDADAGHRLTVSTASGP